MEASLLLLSQGEGAAVSLAIDEPIQPKLSGDEECDFPMEDVDDVKGERELLEDELRWLYKVDYVATIANLKMKLERFSRMSIPLCTLVAMPMVRPTLSSNLQKLEQEFAHRYLEGAASFYVSTTNEAEESSEFKDDEVNGWDNWWKQKNADFNAYVESLPEVNFPKNMKFFVCDGNHRRLAWMNHINRLYSSDEM